MKYKVLSAYHNRKYHFCYIYLAKTCFKTKHENFSLEEYENTIPIPITQLVNLKPYILGRRLSASLHIHLEKYTKKKT